MLSQQEAHKEVEKTYLYSLSATEQKAKEDYITASLKSHIIQPYSTFFPYSTRFSFLEKKNKTVQPCIDYTPPNDTILKNRCPPPLISASFECLGAKVGNKICTKIDRRNA